nr:hypothetical protein [Rubripirellula lacrimiformis]
MNLGLLLADGLLRSVMPLQASAATSTHTSHAGSETEDGERGWFGNRIRRAKGVFGFDM